MKIIWRDQARADVRDAIEYLRERSPSAALATSQTIRQKVTLLAHHPHVGRPGRIENTRELVISGTPYIVAYTVDTAVPAVIILRVLHGRRQWPQDFDKEV